MTRAKTSGTIEEFHIGMSARRWIILLSLPVMAGMGALVALDQRIFLALVGCLGAAAYTLLCMKKPFAAFVFVLFFASSESLSGLQVVAGISSMVALGLIFTAVWVTRLALKKTSLATFKENWMLVGLGIVVLVSSLLHLDGPAGLRPIFTYLQQLLLVVLLVNMVTSPEKLRTAGTVLIASSSLMAVLMIGARLGWMPGGAVSLWTGSMGSAYSQTVTRVSGFFGNPNYTSAQLVLTLPFIVEWWSYTRSLRLRVVLLAAAVAILLAFSYTISVTGFVGLLVYLLVKSTLLGPRNMFLRGGRLALALILGFFIVTTLYPTVFQEKIGLNVSLFRDYIDSKNPVYITEFGTGRGNAWMAALQAVRESPFVGYGPGNGQYAIPGYLLSNPGSAYIFAAHNMYLSIALELGIFGFVLFVFLLVSTWFATMPRYDRLIKNPSPLLKSVNQAVFASLTVMLALGFAMDVNAIKLPWILIGMAVVSGRFSTASLNSVSSATDSSPVAMK